MRVELDESLLDDAARVEEGDPSQMLRAVASSAAQVRRGRTAANEAGIAALTEAGRPRAIVVAGMGGSGIAGDVLAAVTGPACPIPVVVHRGYGLPGWVGAADVVCAVSCSGTTEETLTATDEAIRRGARLLAVGAAGSLLASRAELARAPVVPVTMQVGPRATLWELATPLLVTAARFGLLDLGPGDESLEDAARSLEQVAEACRPDRETFVNPAKSLALDLAGSLPMIWGAGQVGGVAAARMGCQLAENAKLPSIAGVLSEAHHNQVVAFDGPFASASGSVEEDLFRDRVDDEEPLRLRLVLLHDNDGALTTQRRVAATQEIADDRGVATNVIASAGRTPVERLASLIGLVDYASVYLAILHGVDPTPVTAIDDLKRSLARPVP